MIDIVWGSAKDKPIASKALADRLTTLPSVSGYLYIGYPVMGSPHGPVKFDALLLSSEIGLVAFDLVEGTDVADFHGRQDAIASMLDVKLKPYPDLKKGRQLKFNINVVTFAPAKANLPPSDGEYFIANDQSIVATIKAFSWAEDAKTFQSLVAAVQVVTSIRAGKLKREPKKSDSRGARLKQVEESIANLDQHQSQAVIETVDGVQQIRGLAGSGKTIILALKVAYLHSQNPDWHIAVTFNTRSLKDQFRRLINNFTIEQTGTEPDWELIDILNAWGGPGDKERDGIYHKFCRQHRVPFLDFGTAKAKFGETREFAGACAEALRSVPQDFPFYDLILVDEAQDFPPDFLRLCYRFLKEPKRLVYAYDELQSLTGNSVLPPEELFGLDAKGRPRVRLNSDEANGPRQDIILEKCYRNSRPVLATAHAIGFGIYRQKGLVQFFEQDSLWGDVGYVIDAGDIGAGQSVSLARTPETSPIFLEDHSPIEDLIQFHLFSSKEEQAHWLTNEISKNIVEEELRPEDIVVINPDPRTTLNEVSPIRSLLFKQGINTEIAGVSTSADVFVKSGAVTFTGVFRAKGNEAGMVYILNAQDCFSAYSPAALALARNRLFTAITRSKAWVRVLGVGPGMMELSKEWSALKENDYKLVFTYPSDEQKKQLRLINKEMPGKKSARQSRAMKKAADLLSAVEMGDLDADQLISQLQKIKATKGSP